jgi:O-antigen biosynthesis protein
MALSPSDGGRAWLRHFIGQYGRRWLVGVLGSRGDDAANRMLLRYYLWRYPGFTAQRDETVVSGEVAENETAATYVAGKNGHPGITVIVPVYNAYDAVKDCLESVIRWTDLPYRLLVIDDASTDARIRELLAALSTDFSQVRIACNEKNLGYTATINKGCALAGADDVVLLNSDTQVTRGWLAKMAACASCDARIATVTPLSNAAGVFSVPVRNRINAIPRGMTVDEMGLLVERMSMKLRPKVPTGNGFCMYVARTALNAAGDFDAVSFPRGYGEENDFCMRAEIKGFFHVIDDATFIYHQRSGSGGVLKKSVLPASMARLHRMHPGYRIRVLQWLVNDPLDEFRGRLQNAMKKHQNSETG